MKYPVISPTFLLSVALGLGTLPLLAQDIEDDFNDGDDAGWTRYLPLQAFGAPATFSFPDGNSYRIQSAASPDPGQLGAARAGAHQEATVYEAFRVEVDLVNWDNDLGQDIGVLGSLSSVGLGTTNGYAFTYDTNAEGAYLSVVTGEQPTTLSSSPVILVPGQSYRFVLQGFFDADNFVGELRGEIFELNDLENPLVSVPGFDFSYPTGTCGLFNTSTSDAGVTDATFDNYFSTPVTDVDRDGMTDQWEFDYFGELFWFAEEDFDGDGQSNLAEFLAGTDPTDPTDPAVQAPGLVVNEDLGTLGVGSVALVGDTGAGADNAQGYTAAGTTIGGWASNEWVYQFSIDQDLFVTITSNSIVGDPDAFLLNSLETVENGGFRDASGALQTAYLDGVPPLTANFGLLAAGTYYISVDAWGGVSAEFDFTLDFIESDSEFVPIDLGIIGDGSSLVTLDTFGSAWSDTEMGIYDDAGNLLDNNDDAGGGVQSQLILGLPEGTWYVAVSTFNTNFASTNFDVFGGGNDGEILLNYYDGLDLVGSRTVAIDSFDGRNGVAWFSFEIGVLPGTPVAEDLGILGDDEGVLTLDTFGSALEDTEIGLYDAAGNLLDENDDAGDAGQSELAGLALAEGTYYVAVSASDTAFGASGFDVLGGGESGEIVLNFLDGFDVPGSATAVLDGADAAGGVAWFSFEIEAAAPPSVPGDSPSNAISLGILGNADTQLNFDTFGSATSDTELGVFLSDGTFFISNDDAPTGGVQSSLSFTITEGTHYIAAGQYNTVFSANFVATGPSGGGITLNHNGGSSSGTIGAGGALWFSFEIEAAPVVVVPIADDLGILGDDTGVLTLDTFGSVLEDTEIGLYDATGNLLDENDDAGGGGQSELAALALAEGTYYVAVSAYDTTFGVSGFDVSGGGESGEIVLNFSDGLDVAGSAIAALDGADAAGGVAWFSFEIEATPPVVVTPTADDLGFSVADTSVLTLDTFGSTSDTEIGLYDAAGNLLDNNDDAGGGTQSELADLALAEGTYYVAVSTWNTTFGASDFVVTGGGNSGEIVLHFSDGLDVVGSATAVLDELDGAGGVAWFSFEIAVEPVVVIPVADELGILGNDTSVLALDTFGSALEDTEIGLYDAAGNLLDENDDAGEGTQSELVVQNLAEGTYYVAVSAWDTAFGASDFDVSGGGESGEIVLNFSDGLDVTGSATASLDGADAAGGVAWFFFEIVTEPVVIIPVANDLGILGDDTSVLTLDTFGSVLGDTEMGLYDAAGNLLDENDDAGAETFQSELVAQNLAEGTYYVAVSAYNTTFGVSGFDVFGGGESGEIVLNFSDGLDVAGSVTASLDGTDDTGGVAWFSFEIAAEPPTTTVLGGGLEVEVVDSELGRELVVSFVAQEDGLIFELETSEDLQNWSPAPGAVFSQNDNGTQAALPIPDGAGFFGRLFVRLRVTRP